MMDHFQNIYQRHADAYDRMVDAEDCDDRILPTLEAIHPLRGAQVVEVGAGTGRITRLLLRGDVSHVAGFDTSEAMLDVARARLGSVVGRSVHLECADATRLPVPDDHAALFVAGWVFGHQTAWNADAWKRVIDQALGEADRVTRASGHQIILETLGTGERHPGAPNAALEAYYLHLENEHGFTRQAIATDYQFESASAAADACRFFFGEQLVTRILANDWARIPEWTGVWSRAV